MASNFKIEKIELNHHGISNLLSSDAVKKVVEEAAAQEGVTVEKEYLSLDKHPGHIGTRWSVIGRKEG